ncbi:hypothetical protein M2150_001675 [Lachnospiraceae bacterium PM6-15]|uniref:hypothetical protein n=1 Tax=Ohessyouella blattaphilus TaxID=2949333 RepID=UPI003E2845A4
MIDFTNCKINELKMFNGANGKKISVVYEGENYMLKFPPKNKNVPQGSYINSCYSEYVSCEISASLGVETQEVLLGSYRD